MKVGRHLLLETAFVQSPECAMYFNKDWKAIYDDFTTWWAPTISCLREMLRVTLFDILEDTFEIQGHPKNGEVARLAVWARSRPPGHSLEEFYLLDPAFSHGFGEHLISRVPRPTDAMFRAGEAPWVRKL